MLLGCINQFSNLANTARHFSDHSQLFIAVILLLCRMIARASQDRGGDGQMTPLLRLTAGAGAGIIAMSATYPLDMVRGRLTVQEGLKKQYNGIVHCATVIAREVRQPPSHAPLLCFALVHSGH